MGHTQHLTIPPEYEMAPYVLEDDQGQFTFGSGFNVWHGNTYSKTYVTGESKGKVEPISEEKFGEYRAEAEALYGTVDWKGDFVPGLLRPELECSGCEA